ncbi:FKBP-type peptidyl-prolyl cis-trans isomerase, partial [archaeon]|nr:FKBP-type peptidyl-prolyl cis-trans isomerase [archaeon]
MFDEEKPEVLDEEEEQEEEPEETVEEVPEEEEETPVEEETEEPEEEPAEEEEEVHYENAVNKGDFLKVEMTGMSEETEEVFETTNEEEAQEAGIWEEGRTYGPRLVIVGDGFVLRGLDERLPGTSFDEEVEIEIPPEEA